MRGLGRHGSQGPDFIVRAGIFSFLVLDCRLVRPVFGGLCVVAGLFGFFARPGLFVVCALKVSLVEFSGLCGLSRAEWIDPVPVWESAWARWIRQRPRLWYCLRSLFPFGLLFV